MPDTDDMIGRREPAFSAPAVVLIFAIVLIGVQGVFAVQPEQVFERAAYDFALAPQRFWAPKGSEDAYASLGDAVLTLVSTAFLHGGWLHVLVNSGMLLAFGARVARVFGTGFAGAGAWLGLFFISVAAGSMAYLALNGVDRPPAVGASGGVCGLMGAAFLVGFDGQGRSLLGRPFIGLSAAFLVANLVMAAAGPAVVGAGVAWEAHLGGYCAGAALMALYCALRPQPPFA